MWLSDGVGNPVATDVDIRPPQYPPAYARANKLLGPAPLIPAAAAEVVDGADNDERWRGKTGTWAKEGSVVTGEVRLPADNKVHRESAAAASDWVCGLTDTSTGKPAGLAGGLATDDEALVVVITKDDACACDGGMVNGAEFEVGAFA